MKIGVAELLPIFVFGTDWNTWKGNVLLTTRMWFITSDVICVICSGYCYIGYLTPHQHQFIEDHFKLDSSAIGQHMKKVYNIKNPDLKNNFTVLKKCSGKFDCLLHEMLFIRKRNPNLNIQTDSLRTKIFVCDLTL